jgi:hypothetical protein
MKQTRSNRKRVLLIIECNAGYLDTVFDYKVEITEIPHRQEASDSSITQSRSRHLRSIPAERRSTEL